MIINVTPEEYKEIHDIAHEASRRNPTRFDEGFWVAAMRNKFRCQPYTAYEVKVHWNLQKIPSCYHLWPFSNETNFLCQCNPHVSRFSE